MLDSLSLVAGVIVASMSEPSSPKPVKKISRKEITHIKGRALWDLTRTTYGKLFRYMKPYRGRFMIGVTLGILAGLFNVVMLAGFQIIFAVVLSTPETRAQEQLHHKVMEERAKEEEAAAAAAGLPYKAPDHQHVKKEYGEVVLPGIGVVNPVKWILGHTPERVGIGFVIGACAFIPLLIFMRGFLTYLSNYSFMWVGNRILYNLRNDTFQHLLNQSLSFYNRSKIGDLIQTVFNQTRVAQTNAVQLTSVLIQKPISILTIFVFLLLWDPWFTLSSMLIFPLCLGPISYVSKRVRQAGAKEEEEAGALMVNMQESFAGIRVVKAYAREDYEGKRFDAANKGMANSIMRWGKALEIIGPVVETVASLGIAAGLVYAWREHMKAEDFFLIVMALTQIYPHAKELGRVQILLQKCIVATSAVFGILENKPDVQDAPDAKVLPRVRGEVKFDNVTFHYKDSKGRPAKNAAVTNLNLTLEPGKFYALVGPTGAGKSTIFSLLLRYYDTEQGTVSIDGNDVRSVTQTSLRDNIGVVNQDVFLFHDTIGENIRYGRLDATDEEVEAAAIKAHAHEFIEHKKEMYKATVGDGGNNLSGGQKQRISIARAILRNAPILLLDEATSALDTETERIIQEAIQTLSKGKTVVAIAHRLSTVLEADHIVVMKDGHVLDIGNHSDLLQRCELYKRLYLLQFKGGEGDPNKPVADVRIEPDVQPEE